MAELKFAVLFSAVDQLNDKLGVVGEAMGKFTEIVTAGGEAVARIGERMVEWGERVGVVNAVPSEGAEQLHEWSEALGEPAIGMQQSIATMAAMTGLGAEELDEIKEHAIAFANKHLGITTEQWVAGFTRMRGIFQDTAQATQAEDIAAMLERVGVESDAATQLTQTSWSNLRTAAPVTGDELTRAIQVFGLAPEATGQPALGVGWLGASAVAAHAPLSAALALSGEAQRLLGGGRGALMFASMIQGLETATAKGKAHINFSHGLIAALQQLKSQLKGTPMERLAALKAIGVSEEPQMLNLLDHLDEVAAKQKDIAASAGALGRAYSTATADAAKQIKLLHQSVSNLYDTVYSPALPTLNRWLGDLTGVTRGVAGAAEHHSLVAHYAALSLTAIGGGAYYALEGLSALGTMTAFAGKGLEALSKLLDWQSHYLRILYLWDHVKSIASGIDSFRGSIIKALPKIYDFGGALLANPITWYVASALALVAYEIVKHWTRFKAFWANLWTKLTAVAGEAWAWVKQSAGEAWVWVVQITSNAWMKVKTVFSEAGVWLKTTRLDMMKNPSEGILVGIEYPFKAAWHAAEKIGGLFHFHSPPVEGPLREAIMHFRFGEELAKHIQAAPIIAPAREMTTKITAAAAPQVATATGGVTVNLTYSPIINGGSPDDWIKAARRHADELMRIIDSKLQRRSRLEFV